ncbi:LytR/AlgR family response regulator transcription factor [Clostridium sp. DL1XJH146]
MINIAICDDDKDELEKISDYVSKNFKDLDIEFKITLFTEGEDLIEEINLSKEVYDIIFLDIYMQFSNGIDIARKIREFDKACKIIFITSSKEYAIDSYDVKAFYYILKPINEEKLKNVVKEVIETLSNDNKSIFIKNKKGNYRVIYKDILYLESKARVVNIHMKSGEIINFYSILDEFIENLKDERFVKCHKSFFVNMDYILKIENKFVFLKGNVKIPISTANRIKLKENYFNYLFK